MKKKLLSILILGAMLFSAVSCASKEAYDNSSMKAESSTVTDNFYTGAVNDGFDASVKFDADIPMDEASTPEMSPAEPETPNVTEGRKIIYSSNFNLETKEYDKSVKVLEQLCNEYGAWFENSNSYGTAERANRYSYYTIRVPVVNYKSFISSQSAVGIVVSSSENNRDITEQYTDLEARLASAELREERVLVILENADRLDDVLSLERELADIRYEIESLTGSLRKYDSLVSYATVTVSISEVAVYTPEPPATLTFGERLAKGFKSGIESFIDGVEDFAIFISYNFIGVIFWCTVIIVVAVITVKKIKKSKSKKAPETPVEKK
jgi:hypothetical protein